MDNFEFSKNSTDTLYQRARQDEQALAECESNSASISISTSTSLPNKTSTSTSKPRSTSMSTPISRSTLALASQLTSCPKSASDARSDFTKSEHQSSEYEFGGPGFILMMIFGFPLLMYYMYLGAYHFNGQFPKPTHNQSWAEFGSQTIALLGEHAYPSARAWKTYVSFFIFEGCCYLFLPGVYAKGKRIPHDKNKQLVYYCSGIWSLYFTIVTALVMNYTGLFRLSRLISEFGSIMTVAIICAFMISIFAYFSAFYRQVTHRMSGNHVYDFFMGAELNPRLFQLLDLKMFFEVRLPWFILLLVSCGAALYRLEKDGIVPTEIWMLIIAHFLYANACAKGEELILGSWDIYYEKWGFMLIFWNMAGVPMSYCHCSLYLALHSPDTYQIRQLIPNTIARNLAYAGFGAVYLFFYWVWDTTNSQKNAFRAQETNAIVMRRTFPQLPWRQIENPRVVKADCDNYILADGWYGYARKIHYTCDIIFAVSWGLTTGFKSPLPWFYPVFFTIMIIHRTQRDIHRCRQKYGKAWAEYEKLVPYLFVPYLF